jgi:GntR family transcriptional regulator
MLGRLSGVSTNRMTLVAELRQRLNRQRGPLGLRLTNALTSAIEDDVIAAGEVLPPERELAENLGVSRSTLRQCLEQLAEGGLIETRRGAGHFVARRILKPVTRLTGFTDDMVSRGIRPVSKILEKTIMPVPPDTAFRTALPLGTPVFVLVRLRLAGEEILAYERSIVPVTAVGEDYDGTGSLYGRMDQHGGRPKRILQSMRAVEAGTEIADHLKVKSSTAVLMIRRIGYGSHGVAVEDAISWYRGDRYDYVAEING